MYKIENYKKNTITLDEIEKLLKIDDYTVLYDEVNKLIDEGRINIIKSSGGNGRKPGLYMKYRIIRDEEELKQYVDEIEYKLSTRFDVSYYRNHLKKYTEHRKYILMLNDYILNKKEKLQNYISMNERSFEIWHREKFLQKEEGKTILKNLKFDITELNFYETSEPLAYYSKCRKIPQNILIIENKDTYYTFRKHLINNDGNVLGKEIDTVIYGGGKNIIKAFNDFDISVEDYIADRRNTLYYFGDLDYEGIIIYESFLQKAEQKYNVYPFVEGYIKMIDKYNSDKINLPATKEGQNRNIKGSFLDRFNDEYKKKIKDILEADLYIPQEIINIDDL